jgi:hypothetical protein
MSEDVKDRPFVLLARLVIAHDEGDYTRAAEYQHRLAALGWFVSRKPPEEPRPARRKRRPAAAKDGAA